MPRDEDVIFLADTRTAFVHLCCDLGLLVHIDKQKDCLYFAMRSALTGAYVMESSFILK